MITQLNKIKDNKIRPKLKAIIEAILSMRGRVTMLGIARWNGKYSYRTIERFFDMKIDWLGIKWELIKDILNEEIILVPLKPTNTKNSVYYQLKK